MNKRKFPPGWDEARIRAVLAHYDEQTEDEQFAEIEVAREAEGATLISVPTELVPEVRALLARKKPAAVNPRKGPGADLGPAPG